MKDIEDQDTIPIIVHRNVKYPEERGAIMRIIRVTSLSILLVILVLTSLVFFSVPHEWKDPFSLATPTVANCVRETLINTGTSVVTQLNEVC